MTGADLRAIRERLGLGREAFGRALGYNHRTAESVITTVYRLERAASVPGAAARVAQMMAERVA